MEHKIRLIKSFFQTMQFGIKMNKPIAQLLAFIILILAFDTLFYSKGPVMADLGINLLIFSIITLVVITILHKPRRNNTLFWWGIIGIIFSAIKTTYVAKDWSYFMFFLSYGIALGSLFREKMNNVVLALIQWFVHHFFTPVFAVYFWVNPKTWAALGNKSWDKKIKIWFIPLSLAVLFILIYSQANFRFHEIFLEPIITFFSNVDFSASDRFFLWLMASIFIAPLLLDTLPWAKIKIPRFQPYIQRIKINRTYSKPITTLNQELRIGTKSFLLLNLLVAVYNILDIRHLWLSNESFSASELSQFVHQGTNSTIASIFLGTAIIAIFFRQNLNFHPRNEKLIFWAKAWIIQNVFLCLSTGLRNFHYIQAHGLTEKRMGVVIFLMATLLGLLFIWQKVVKKHSIMHFLNKLSFGFYIILLGYSLLDHHKIMIEYAAHIQKGPVDLQYLVYQVRESNESLMEHRGLLEQKSGKKLHLIEGYSEYKMNDWREFQWKKWRDRQAYHGAVIVK